MSTARRCDICGNVFDNGFCIDVFISTKYEFTNIAEYLPELGKKDVCIDCYYKVKEMLNNSKGE